MNGPPPPAPAGSAAAPGAGPGDRRPLRSRSWPVMAWLARTVARAGISPNAVSVAGLAGALVAGAALAATAGADAGPGRAWLLVLAAAGIQFRLVCNLIDGLVAIEGGRRSAVGELYNEVPDRVADAAVLVGAGYAATGDPTMGWAAALAAVLTAYIRAVGKGAGVGSDFGGPMDKSARMMTVTAACLWLALTPEAWPRPAVELALGTGGLRLELLGLTLAVIAALSLLTCLLRLRRIARRLRAAADSASEGPHA